LITVAPTLGVIACDTRRRAPVVESDVIAARERGPGSVFDAGEWETVRAACARLIPSDAEPGATEANVVNYIDAQLALPSFNALRSVIAAGVRQMNVLARSFGASRFVELEPTKQDEVLRRLQRGVRLGPRRSSQRFFVLLLTFTLEGYLSHPIYGGNRDGVGWRFFGFDPRPPHPRRPYRSPA
jgi:gluconate 2-dehydrogenase gamma chain